MVTAVEEAALVLAAFPLVLDGLSHWLEGVRKGKRWWRIQLQLKNYKMRLQSQKVIYQNTLELLLADIVQADDIAAMLAEPGGDIWKKAEYDSLLHRRLDGAYDTFFENLEFILTTLSEVEKKLGIEVGKASQVSQTFLVLSSN